MWGQKAEVKTGPDDEWLSLAYRLIAALWHGGQQSLHETNKPLVSGPQLPWQQSTGYECMWIAWTSVPNVLGVSTLWAAEGVAGAMEMCVVSLPCSRSVLCPCCGRHVCSGCTDYLSSPHVRTILWHFPESAFWLLNNVLMKGQPLKAEKIWAGCVRGLWRKKIRLTDPAPGNN